MIYTLVKKFRTTGSVLDKKRTYVLTEEMLDEIGHQLERNPMTSSYCVAQQVGVHSLQYDPKENKWGKVAPMTTRRLGVAVAVLGGFLYAIGGSDGQCPLNTVERYDPRQNKWSPVSPMSTRRKHLGCAVFNNFIYAVGGRDDCMELSSAERYNPHSNTWNPIVAMTSRRSGAALVASLLTVPPMPPNGLLPCNVAKKCHSALIP
ncbi:hypothetical protein ANN_04061 [Periplaneta americana]|uniref:Uncharacterized protein n=1 Tax=Periplaneta americana TaxID=6978 RepID=A0ABQ8T9E3_PERAM|nr:hypothetical protein ANN_04061 [Periplaneta americana]